MPEIVETGTSLYPDTLLHPALSASKPQWEKTTAEEYDRRRTWFAYALPVVMAALLTLVPLAGTRAAAAFALVLFPLALWTAARDTERALYVYCAWCWMDGTIRGIFGGGAVMVLARDVLLIIILIGWGLQRSRTRITDPIRVPPGTLLVGLFTLNCLLEMLNPYSGGLLRSLAGLKVHVIPILLFFIGYDVFRRRGQVRSLTIFLALATLVVSGVSYVQYVHGADWTHAHYPGSDKVISQNVNSSEGSDLDEGATFKPPGTTGFGGGTAGFAAYAFPLVFALLLLSPRRGLSVPMKGFFVLVLLAYVLTFFVNGVRSALVEAVCGVLLCSVLVGGRLRGRALSAAIVCLVFGLVGYLVSVNVTHGGSADRYATLFANPMDALHQDRTTFLEDLPGLLYHSSMGIGMGSTGAAAGYLGPRTGLGFDPFSESYLGTMILETGVIGALLITVIALFFIRRGFLAAQRQRDTDDKLMAMGLVAILAMMFAGFFVVGVLIGPPGSVLFWLFGAILLRVYGGPQAPNALRGAGKAASAL